MVSGSSRFSSSSDCSTSRKEATWSIIINLATVSVKYYPITVKQFVNADLNRVRLRRSDFPLNVGTTLSLNFFNLQHEPMVSIHALCSPEIPLKIKISCIIHLFPLGDPICYPTHSKIVTRSALWQRGIALSISPQKSPVFLSHTEKAPIDIFSLFCHPPNSLEQSPRSRTPQWPENGLV